MGKIDEIEQDAAKKAAYFENRTEAQELADHKWAEKNGLSFSGPGALTKAIAASKQRAAKKSEKVQGRYKLRPRRPGGVQGKSRTRGHTLPDITQFRCQAVHGRKT